ncbi:MAG: phosphatidate cytidylyltransferase, partial [Paracoccaceae bacterium]
ADLRPRLLSALVMVAVGATEIWIGGPAFAALVMVLTGVMAWELASITAAGPHHHALIVGFAAALSLLLIRMVPHPAIMLLLFAPSLLGLALPRRDKVVFAAYALLIMLTGYGFITLRNGSGIEIILWLVLVVVASDILGYFAGRILGGPKFWPAVSPKKTWSGTVAGWIGAALVGLGFWAAGQGGAALIWLSPLVAFAGQMGDIAESAIKRRAGVKDSSSLIPGHGGFLDRFDALAGAVVVVALLAHLMPLPIGGQ